MKKLLIFFAGICAGICMVLVIYANNQPEYEVNLIDQNTIQVKSNLSGKIYLVDPDKVNDTFEIDNI